MKLLLDTCAISELRRPDCHVAAKRVFESAADEDLFISAISIGELKRGINLLDSGSKKELLAEWLETIDRSYGERVLPITRNTALIWGEITARCQKSGIALSAADGLIAASAIENGLHIFTRNSRDFRPTGALVVDPWTQ